MSDIIPNVVVSMPSQLFTLARKFQAASNGKIFIGKIDTDPTIPENQIQVYLENEDGTTVPVSQPLIINQAGYPVYNGQIAKFVTVQGHSMAVYDSYGAQQFYYQNVLKYDPDQLRQELGGSGGYKLIPSIESQLIPEIKKSYFMADALGITPDINDCATVIMNLFNNGVRKIRFPAGLYRFRSAINVNDGSGIYELSGIGVSAVNVAKNTIPDKITNDFCVDNNIVAFCNEDGDFFSGSCSLFVSGISFLGLVGDNVKTKRYSSNKCFVESSGVLNAKVDDCSFFQWKTALDLKLNSHSKNIKNNKFQHCGLAVDLSGVVFNSFVCHNYFVENDIGVKLGSGSQVSVSDNEFALDAEYGTIGVISEAMSCLSLDRNYFEDYGDPAKPKKDIGALAYDIKFNPYANSPDSISMFGNTINMQGRSDYCIRINNYQPSLKLPLFDFSLSKNQMMNASVSQVLIPDYSNLGINASGITVTGDYFDARREYKASFGENGSKISGDKGISCTKISLGQYKISVDFGVDAPLKLTAIVSPLINLPIMSVIQDMTHNTVDVALFNRNGELLDCPFMILVN